MKFAIYKYELVKTLQECDAYRKFPKSRHCPKFCVNGEDVN